MNKQLSINIIIIFCLIIILLMKPVFSQELSFNESFCDDEIKGFNLLGPDFYLLCEDNFVDEYYQGYAAFEKSKGETVKPTIPLPPSVRKPINLEPKNLYQLFLLEKLGYNKSQIIIDKDIFNKTFNKTTLEKNNSLENESALVNQSEENQSKNLVNNTKEILKTPKTTNQNDLVNLETSQSNTDNQKDSSIQEYFLYLAVGLFILLILYIGIHTLAKIHSEKKEIALARSYVTLLQKQNYTNKQIKQFFIQKGYEESFINKVLKTQDFNP